MNPDNITPPQPQLPGHHVSNSMKFVMLLLGLALLATLGYFTWFVGSEQEAAEEVAPSVRDKTEETVTASWKTFTTTYGYTLKYPPTVAPSSQDDGTGNISFSENGAGAWEYEVNITKNEEGLSLAAALTAHFAANRISANDATVTDITVGSKPAKQYVIPPTTDSTGTYSVVLLYGTDIMVIASRDGGKEFSELLSTFNFTK